MQPDNSTREAPKKARKSGRKRPGRFRRWLLRPAMWGLAGLALMVFLVHWGLQSDWAGSYFAQRAEQSLHTLLDREVSIGAVHLKLLPLGVEMEEFRMSGVSPEDPPFVELTKLVVDARLIDLRRRAITLGEVRLIEPKVDLDFLGGGHNNLPKLVKNATEDATDRDGVGFPINLSIHHLAIERGELYLEQHKMPLELTAKALELELVGRSRTELTGRLDSEELEITLPRAKPIVGKVGIRVVTDEEGVRLVKGSVEGPDLSAIIQGHVSWEDREWVIEVDGQGDTRFFQRLGYLENQIDGPFTLKGGFAWSRKSWGFRAEVDSTGLLIFDRDLQDVRTVVSGDRNGLRFDLESAQYAAGSLSGSVNIETQKGNRSLEVDLIVDGLDLQTILDDQRIPVEDLAGKVSGAFDYRFPFGSAKEGQGWADLQIDPDFEQGLGKIPIEGSAPLIIEEGIIRTQAARLTGPFQRLEMGGFFDLETRRGEFVYKLETDRVERLAMLIPFEGDEERIWLPTSGSGLLAGSLTLEPGRPSTRLEIDLIDVEAPGATASRLQGAIEIGIDGIPDLRMELLNEDAGLIVTGSAPIARADGSLTDTPFSIAVDAAAWPLSQAAPWLPFDVPIDGPVSGSMRIWGELADPTGQLRARVAPASFEEMEIDAVDLWLDFDSTRMRVERLALETGAGEVTLSGSLDRATERLDMEIRSDPLQLTKPPFSEMVEGDLDGQVVLTGSVRGLISAPEIVADLRADHLTLDDRILSGDGSATVHVELEDERLDLAGDLLGVVDLRGGGRLDDQGLDLELAIKSAALEELFQLTGGESETEFTGSLEGTVTIQSDFEDLESWMAFGELSRVDLSYRDLGMRNLEPVLVNLSPEGVEIESFFIGDPASDSELFISGDIRGDETKSLELRFQSSLDAQWLALFLPDLGLRSGTFDMLAVIDGTVDLPEVNGQARVQNGRVILEDMPFAIEEVDGVLLFYPDQIVVDRLDARAAGGTLKAEGNLRPFQESGELNYRVQLSAIDLRVPFPEGWLTRASGELVLSSTEAGRQVRGAIEVDQALYLEDLNLGVTQMISGLFSRDRLEVERADEFSATTEINIAVAGPGALRVRNNLADLHGDLDLVIRGTMSSPVLFGTVDVERGGTIEFGVNEYEIQRGVVTFANPYQIEPIIDVSARATVRQYDVTLNLSGTLDQLNTSFTSNPPLAEAEVLSLLTSGEESLASTGTGSRSEADSASRASTMMAGQAASLVSQRTGRLFGLDRFQVQPLTTSSGELSQTRVTVGKQLSRDLYVTYSYDPESTAEDIYRLEWNVRRGMTLVLTQNGDESYSVDVRWEKSF